MNEEVVPMFATEVKGYLKQLQAERALAEMEGFREGSAYIADLNEEIELASDAYVCAAVTEIAMLRGELYGRAQG
jgi:hypothetical protein